MNHKINNIRDEPAYQVGLALFYKVHENLLMRTQGTGRFLGIGGLLDSLDYTMGAVRIYNQFAESTQQRFKYEEDEID